MINSNLRLVVSIAKRYRPRALAARPDPGGSAGPDSRRGEVRLAPRATSSRPTPPGGSGRRSSAACRTRRAPSGCRCTCSSASARIDRAERELCPAGRIPTDEELAGRAKSPSSRCARCATAAHGHEPRPPGGRGGGHHFGRAARTTSREPEEHGRAEPAHRNGAAGGQRAARARTPGSQASLRAGRAS